jgi:hypothetical protein
VRIHDYSAHLFHHRDRALSCIRMGTRPKTAAGRDAILAELRRLPRQRTLDVWWLTDPSDNGLERFITATRRQNFLVPPGRHRAFPFAELHRGFHH